MEVIALVGCSDGGKTTTLKKLISELCCNRGAIIQNVNGVARCSTFITPKRLVPPETLQGYIAKHTDVTIVVEYNGKRVGITTIGDGWALIKTQLDRIGCCDKIVLACHDSKLVYQNIQAYKNAQGCCMSSLQKVWHVKCVGKMEPKFQQCCDLSVQLSINEIISLL